MLTTEDYRQIDAYIKCAKIRVLWEAKRRKLDMTKLPHNHQLRKGCDKLNKLIEKLKPYVKY